MKRLLFVYGSLMKGFGNHGQLAGVRFVRRAMVRGFELYDLGAFPAMVERGDGHVHGELYDVDIATLDRLDRFEGCPSLYQRRLVTTTEGETNPWPVWTYVYNRDVRPETRIRSGKWRVRGDGPTTIVLPDGAEYSGTPLEIVSKMKSRALFQPGASVSAFVAGVVERGDELGFVNLKVDLEDTDEGIARAFVHELLRTGAVR